MASPAVSFLLLLILTTLITSAGASDLRSDSEALLAFRSGFGLFRFNWKTSTSPCSWTGITCKSSRVDSLRLPATGLAGPIPPGTIGNLTALRTLSLHHNSLSGHLPSDLSGASHLIRLYLQSNNFSGEIPPALYALQSLVSLNLAFNGFSGEISPAFNNLTRLRSLFLYKNNLSGQIPDLDLPNLVQFNLSYNQLTGSIPARLHKWPANAFLDMPLCGGPLSACPPAPPGNLSGGAIAGISIGVTFAVLSIVTVVYYYFRLRRRAQAVNPPPEPPLFLMGAVPEDLVFCDGGDGGIQFDVGDLQQAVYYPLMLARGTLLQSMHRVTMTSQTIVILKHLDGLIVSEAVFRQRMAALGGVVHDNILRLRAYFYKQLPSGRLSAFVVYDYMPEGSLYEALHGALSDSPNWNTRYQIALAAARGIGHIHSICSDFHGNIKSANIVLLEEPYYARVSEYGLFHLIRHSRAYSDISGYVAPEGMGSQEADVYGFGVLLLELLTSKAPRNAIAYQEGGDDLPFFARLYVNARRGSEVMDINMLAQPNEEQQALELLQIALECVRDSPQDRPQMPNVLHRIEMIQG